MPYKDRTKQRAYQLNRMKARRLAWLAENGPCKACGAADNLQVDHINPMQKVSHKVWSWSDAKRAEELVKCQVLCLSCHRKKTHQQIGTEPPHGTVARYNHRSLKCRCDLCRTAAVEYMTQRRLLTGRGSTYYFRLHRKSKLAHAARIERA
jgi:hypothetical protein